MKDINKQIDLEDIDDGKKLNEEVKMSLKKQKPETSKSSQVGKQQLSVKLGGSFSERNTPVNSNKKLLLK